MFQIQKIRRQILYNITAMDCKYIQCIMSFINPQTNQKQKNVEIN